MAVSQSQQMEASIGVSIRKNRLRAGMTQVQLARAISRSGKFLSEVENGKARITARDLERLATAMGVSRDRLTQIPAEDDGLIGHTPRRIRDTQPSGMTIMTLTQLLNHLDRSGWIRNAKLWMISREPFPEERDVALVEQIAALVATKDVSLRYIYEVERLPESAREHVLANQGTLDAVPDEVQMALRWSNAMKPHLDPASERVIGYAADWCLPDICGAGTLMWVETDDVSWSDVMPLLFARARTRTFENPNETVTFWYHLPRDTGSRVLLDIAQQLKSR